MSEEIKAVSAEEIQAVGVEVHGVEIKDGTQRYLFSENEYSGDIRLTLQVKRPGVSEEKDPWIDLMSVKFIRGEAEVTFTILLTKPMPGKTKSPALFQRYSYGADEKRNAQEIWFLSKTDDPDQELEDLKALDLFYGEADLPKTLDVETTVDVETAVTAFLVQAKEASLEN